MSGAPSPREEVDGPRPAQADLDRFAGVKLIGLGGVGGIVARYLTVYLAAADAAARLTLVDGDAFELHNAERMTFSREGNKAAVVREDLLDLVEGSRVTLAAVEEYVTPENAGRLVREGDLVLLAVDNHATRRLVDAHCARLADVCLVSGGNDGVGADASGALRHGTYGNVQVHQRVAGRDRTPPLAAYHPEIAEPRDVLPTELSCTEALASVPQLLFTNLATASAMLNALLAVARGRLGYAEVCFDVEQAVMRALPLPAAPTPKGAVR